MRDTIILGTDAEGRFVLFQWATKQVAVVERLPALEGYKVSTGSDMPGRLCTFKGTQARVLAVLHKVVELAPPLAPPEPMPEQRARWTIELLAALEGFDQDYERSDDFRVWSAQAAKHATICNLAARLGPEGSALVRAKGVRL